MEIKFKKYLISQSANSDRFDLKMNIKRKSKKTGEFRSMMKNMGFDMTLETCIYAIVMAELKKKNEVVELREFLAEFKKEKEELLKLVKLN